MTLSLQVQVVPWVLSDSNFVRQPSQRLDPSKTVFVGALHGMMTAEGLAHFMNDLFGNVVYAGIDTDKHKYPIGKLWLFADMYNIEADREGLLRAGQTLNYHHKQLNKNDYF